MEVVTGAMSTLLPKLGDLLKEEYELQKGVRDEIMSLITELESMQVALEEVSEAPIDQPPKKQVKLWARDVKELSYDVEDTIDAFMVRVDTRAPKTLHGLTGFINRSIDLLTKAPVRHKIGTDIKDIKRRIMEVKERRDRNKVDNVAAKPNGPTIDSLRLSALYKKATELVGTEEKRDGLIKRLTEGDEASKQQLKIVSIVGFGGLGKTTLANVVYQQLKEQFDCGAFISVSLNPNMEKIFKNILRQLDKDKYHQCNIDDEAQLINELREFLRNRRYFVVIDDIWNNSQWERIRHALIENECGSRIITTTRILDVAKHVGGVYQLEPLSPDDSSKLFHQRIFGVEDECPHNQLAEVSERILKKCGGVPLAIITIASLLASKKEKENTQKYWSKVCQSIGSGLEDSLDVNNMRRILSISYYDLPPHLKTCLVYLSLYPEDREIIAVHLIWKWIGEGFVHKEQGKGLREVGEDYLDELINKSLIQLVDFNVYNKAGTCRVHDMVLDLIRSLSKEEHFLTTLGGQQPVTVPTKIRRLSLQISSEDDVKQLSTMSLSHVRSLTMFQEAFCLLPALSSFPVLRALDLQGCAAENRHCKYICNLFHLRYLNLSWTPISEIPKEIGNLQSLQVLDISLTRIKELPSTFVQLRQLVCLRGSSMGLPDGFGTLKCLQELPAISIRSPTMLHDLGGLTELRRLDICFDEWDERYEEPFLHCLSNLVSLEILDMFIKSGGLGSRCENLSPGPQLLRSIDISSSTIQRVPRWMSSLSSLSYLAIKLETLGVEDLQVLGGIPSLGDLKLEVEQPTERLIIDSGYPFRCLRKLEFSFSGDMEVVFAQKAMQKLQTLKLSFGVFGQSCDFDFGLENLSSLKHASVDISYSTIQRVPRWMSSLSSLSSLDIKLETLGVEDLQVLGGIPSLGDLKLEVEQPTKGPLIIGSGYPFRCLRKLEFSFSGDMEVVFAQKAMQKLGVEDLQVLGAIPSLGDLSLEVRHPTEGRDERLIIGSGYPFRCLRKLKLSFSGDMEVVFAQGAMQKLQTLELSFGVFGQSCDFDFGLENLSSLKHAFVDMRCVGAEPQEVEAAIRRAIDMNPNNPTLKLKVRCKASKLIGSHFVGRIIEPRRLSLTPDMLEACECLKDWESADEWTQHQLEDSEIAEAIADLENLDIN